MWPSNKNADADGLEERRFNSNERAPSPTSQDLQSEARQPSVRAALDEVESGLRQLQALHR